MAGIMPQIPTGAYSPAKAALVMQGLLDSETVRPPLMPISDAEREGIRKALIYAGELESKVGAAKASS